MLLGLFVLPEPLRLVPTGDDGGSIGELPGDSDFESLDESRRKSGVSTASSTLPSLSHSKGMLRRPRRVVSWERFLLGISTVVAAESWNEDEDESGERRKKEERCCTGLGEDMGWRIWMVRNVVLLRVEC